MAPKGGGPVSVLKAYTSVAPGFHRIALHAFSPCTRQSDAGHPADAFAAATAQAEAPGWLSKAKRADLGQQATFFPLKCLNFEGLR
jgi:hypothetical protein